MKHLQNHTRRILALLLILLFLPLLPGTSCADGGKVLTIPKRLTTISRQAFRNDTSLQKVVIQEGTERIESLAFADSSIREIQLPASLTYIAEDAFKNTSLETVTAPKGSFAYQWAREHKYITEYRALLIGEKTFLRNNKLTDVDRNENDAKKMAAMLGRVYGPTGEKFQVTRKTNIGRNTIKSAIQTTFAGTMDHDVSLFFIATHGNSDTGGDGDLEMPYNGDPDDYDYYNTYFESKRYLPFSTLAEWLSTMVNGKVIVILESCGAGSSIYEANGGKNRGEKTEDELSEDFVQAAVKAFAKADPGIMITTDADPDSFRKSTGDLRQPKFYVLAAAAHEEESLGEPNSWDDPMNLFTRWLIEGVGEKGNSPADLYPTDSILALDELYQYIQYARDHYSGPGTIYSNQQHVQVYPEDSNQAIFLLK